MTDQITRQPLNLVVNATAAIRAGSYPGPYSIINSSLTETIWIANNPAVAPGQGTSVSPGTSLTWTPVSGTDLYIIMGASVVDTFANVIISFNTLGWQPNPAAIAVAALNSGNVIVDQPITIANTTMPVSGTSGPYDLARYNSIYASVSNTANSITTCYFVWTATIGGLLIASDIFNFMSNGGSRWNGQIPVKARYLTIINSGTGNGVGVNVFASNRPAPGGISQSLPYYTLPYLARIAGSNLLTNGNVQTYIPPWFGKVKITCIISFASAVILPQSIFLQINGPANITAPNNIVKVATFETNGGGYNAYSNGYGYIETELDMWGTEYQLMLYNFQGVTITNYTVLVTPVRYQP